MVVWAGWWRVRTLVLHKDRRGPAPELPQSRALGSRLISGATFPLYYVVVYERLHYEARGDSVNLK
jgi:hypothetical protein